MNVTIKQLAAMLELTPQRVSQFKNEGCPVNKDGSFPLKEIISWYRHSIMKVCMCQDCGKTYKQN